jgi:hypothetical protein
MAYSIIVLVWAVLGVSFGFALTKLAYKYIDLVSSFSLILTAVVVAFLTVAFAGGGVALSILIFLS